MMFPVRTSETSVDIQLKTRQYIPGPRPGPDELIVPFQGVRWSRRLCVIFRNIPFLYGEVLLDSKSTPKVNNHPFSAVCEWLLKYLRLPAVTGDRPPQLTIWERSRLWAKNLVYTPSIVTEKLRDNSEILSQYNREPNTVLPEYEALVWSLANITSLSSEDDDCQRQISPRQYIYCQLCS
jgi:hypothetical protein